MYTRPASASLLRACGSLIPCSEMRHFISAVTAPTDPRLNASPQSETSSFLSSFGIPSVSHNMIFSLFCASFSFFFSGDEEGEGTALAMSQRGKAYPGQRGLCIESIRGAQTLDCH